MTTTRDKIKPGFLGCTKQGTLILVLELSKTTYTRILWRKGWKPKILVSSPWDLSRSLTEVVFEEP